MKSGAMIFVTGAPRSGTSLTCQVLASLGVEFGSGLAGAHKANPHGFFENMAMRRVLKAWLRRVGADPIGQWPFPALDWRPTASEVEEFRAEVSETLSRHGAEAHKDPKMLPLWKLAVAAFPDARWVVVRRDPDAIARSCLRTQFMQAFDTLSGWRDWADDVARYCGALRAATDAVEVWPDPSDPGSFLALADALGLRWNEDAVHAVLHPEAWGRAS